VTSGGCAVISSTATVMHHTSQLLQAALVHLESIVYNPFAQQNGVNGHLEGVEGSGEESKEE